jgi:hypothetical protein
MLLSNQKEDVSQQYQHLTYLFPTESREKIEEFRSHISSLKSQQSAVYGQNKRKSLDAVKMLLVNFRIVVVESEKRKL